MHTFFSLLILLFSLMSYQPTGAQDSVRMVRYPHNIYKLVYQPAGYKTNENVSDAVILKPLLRQAPVAIDSNMTMTIPGFKSTLVRTIKTELGYGFKISLAENERVYGGGERALPLNRRGYAFDLYNNPWYGYGEGADNLNFSVPFFISSAGYGIFFDNPSRGRVDIGKSDSTNFIASFFSGELNMFFIPGNNQAEILSNYHKLTGTQPLPPRWALGNFMSRFGYTSTKQAEDIAAEMKKQHIPFDAIIFDLFWFGDSIKQTMGNLQWVNKQKWPDPKGMISGFNKQHINSILITEPFILKSSLNYNNSKQFHAVDNWGKPYMLTDFYFGNGGLIDIFRNDAKDWFWKQHVPQMNNGVEAWWGDLGEPEKHPKDLYHNLKDMGFNRLFSADEVHNIYGHNWTKMLYEKYSKHYPDKRLFSLNRSGFAGSQRYNIFPWSGDVSRSWGGLRAQLPIMLGMSMSGIPYIHADAGGFAGGEADNELYTRWLQFAAFTPILRPHGTALFEVDKQAISYPSEPALIDTPYRDIVREYINLRYKLLPYIYTLAYKQAKEGTPLVAPLSYWFPGDSLAVNIENQYMFGENIMVAPVTEKDVTQQAVYLPGNVKWYNVTDMASGQYNGEAVENIETGRRILGRKSSRLSYNAAAPLEKMPLFVREGSFIPVYDATRFSTTADLKSDTIHVYYYPSEKPSNTVLYFDDGADKNAMAKKAYDLVEIRSSGGDNNMVSVKYLVSGKYKGKPVKRFIKFHAVNYSGNLKVSSSSPGLTISK